MEKTNRKSGRTTKRVNDYIEELLTKGGIEKICDHNVIGEGRHALKNGVYIENARLATADDQQYADDLVFHRIKNRLQTEHRNIKFTWSKVKKTIELI